MTKAWSWLHSDVIRHLSTRVPEGRRRARGCREVSLGISGRACQRFVRDVRKFEAASALLNDHRAGRRLRGQPSAGACLGGQVLKDLQRLRGTSLGDEEMVVVEGRDGIA